MISHLSVKIFNLSVNRIMSVDEETFRSLSGSMDHSQLLTGVEEVDPMVVPKEDHGWISLRVRKG